MITEIGKECEKYIKHGALVPDRIINAMVFNELRQLQGQSWILDGKLLILWKILIWA